MIARIRAWWRAVLNRRAVDRAVDDEVRACIEILAQQKIAAGMPPDLAAREARLEIGGVEQVKERTRATRPGAWLDELGRDLRHAARGFRRTPGFALTVVVILAIGIGANAAIFSVVRAVLLTPLPVADPDRLVLFSADTSEGTRSSTTPPGDRWDEFSSAAYLSLRDTHAAFDDIAAFASGENSVTVRMPDGRADAPIRASAHLVSGNYFAVLGASTGLGRVLSPDDDRASAPGVAVVSDGFWRRRLDGSAAAVGRTITINDLPFTIIGVMPQAFFGERVRQAPDFWVPLVWQPQIQKRPPLAVRQDDYWLSLIGRLRPGETRAGAQAATTMALQRFLTAQVGASLGDEDRRRIATSHVEMVSGARGIADGRDTRATLLGLLQASVGLVLLIACANVATLLLSRASARQGEIAMRRALGASAGRIMRQALTESALLAAAGAGGGIALAAWMAPALLDMVARSTPVPATTNIAVLGFTVGVAGIVCLMVGVGPALRLGRIDVLTSLRSGGRITLRARRWLGVRDPLIVLQIAISLVLVLGSALLVRSLWNLEISPVGFDEEQVLVARIDPRLAGVDQADAPSLYERLYDQVSAAPGIERVTLARYSPFSGSSSTNTAQIEGYTPGPGEHVAVETIQVGPTYPETLGMPLVAGRAIGRQDRAGAPLVAVANQSFAAKYFLSRSPLGHHVDLRGHSYEIVGIVGDAQFHSAREPVRPLVLIAMLQETGLQSLDCELEVRTRGDATLVAGPLRQAVKAVDSRLEVTRTRTLRSQVLQSFAAERTATALIGTFALLALALAAMGLYGVVSYSVTRRTNEIGVRMALGATRGRVLSLILRETIRRLIVGVAVGLVLSFVSARLVSSQLFGVSSTDPLSIAAAVAGISCVALVTSLLPARRAARIDPVTALRADWRSASLSLDVHRVLLSRT